MMEFIFFYRGTALIVLSLLLLAIALYRGGMPEKILAGTFVGWHVVARLYNFIGSDGATIWTLSNYQQINTGHLVMDGVALIIFVWIALQANRYYPLFIAGAQVIAVLSHLSKFWLPDASALPPVYAAFERGPFYFQMVALGLGIGFYIWRSHKYGNRSKWAPIRDWRAPPAQS